VRAQPVVVVLERLIENKRMEVEIQIRLRSVE
jgi:hypothetical protein